MNTWSIPIYIANLATFEESWIFAPFERRQRPNAIWCDMKYYAHHFFSTLRIFYVEMATSEREGLHIRSWKTTQVAVRPL